MTDVLLTVDAAYATRGGVELSPRIVPSELGIAALDTKNAGPVDVLLELPDGTTKDARAELSYAHISGPKPPFALVRLLGLTESDVPSGTRVLVRGA